MSRFIQGDDRHQATLFPESLDEYVAEDSTVRVIDVFVDDLDISGLGFKAEPADTGRPAYHPRTMLKLYIYGYLNRVHSSRRLAEVEASIERYLAELSETDQREPATDKTQRLSDKIAAMKQEMSRLKKLEARMLEAPDKQVSLTDPDARSMNARGSGIVGYNVQSAVDTKHHLIVAHEVTNVGSDRRQLTRMADQAKEAIGINDLHVAADRGYYRSEELRTCEHAGITAYVPKPNTSGNKAKGQFDRSAFRYIADDDEYECPAGQRLVWHMSRHENGMLMHRYWTSVCGRCPIKSQCTTEKERRVSRWEHEHVLERAQVRLDEHPEVMKLRRSTVEHPFGTLKAWMGVTHFSMKRLKHVNTEMSLHVLAWKIKRVINLLGTRRINNKIETNLKTMALSTPKIGGYHTASAVCCRQGSS